MLCYTKRVLAIFSIFTQWYIIAIGLSMLNNIRVSITNGVCVAGDLYVFYNNNRLCIFVQSNKRGGVSTIEILTRHLNVYGIDGCTVYGFVTDTRATGLGQNQNCSCTLQFYSESWYIYICGMVYNIGVVLYSVPHLKPLLVFTFSTAAAAAAAAVVAVLVCNSRTRYYYYSNRRRSVCA